MNCKGLILKNIQPSPAVYLTVRETPRLQISRRGAPVMTTFENHHSQVQDNVREKKKEQAHAVNINGVLCSKQHPGECFGK